MKKIGLLLGLSAVCLLISTGCGWFSEHYTQIPRCETITAPKGLAPLAQVYKGKSPGACVAFLAPFDQAGWYASRLNSHRLRGEDMLRLGCTHCPGDQRDCASPNDCGGCNTATLYFDFSLIQEDAEVAVAYLAVFVLENRDDTSKVLVEGRPNVAGDLVQVAGKPEILGNWVLFDITPFVCRGIVERRNSASLDLSLPCGTDQRTKLATLALADQNQPTIIIEYR
ncbi:MAG: hypothetical protein V1742_10095 [Pseudomonadota bacterium]